MGKTKSRGNGQGTVYKRSDRGTWEARVVVGWKIGGEPPHKIPVYKTKGGFTTKRDAVMYLSKLSEEIAVLHPPKGFEENFILWKEKYEPRVGKTTMAGYNSAFKHYAKLYPLKIDRISANDLQDCIDKCKAGKRTKQQMKVVAGLVFKYAIDDDQISKNNAANLYVGDDETTHYEPLTEEELKTIENSGNMYADYIVALCYLGHRPTEFFGFKKSDYFTEGEGEQAVHYISGGIKTEAGKNRSVTVPPKVVRIIEDRLKVEGTDLLFPRYDHNRKGEFTGFSVMPTDYFNKHVFKPLTESLGIVGKVAYSTRHTYSNKIKKVAGADKDKAELMGHTDYETTKKHYQSSTLSDLKAITDQIV